MRRKEEAGRAFASWNTLSLRIHPPTNATVLHPYSVITEETSGKNGCFDSEERERKREKEREREANVTCLRYLPQSAPRMIYIPFRDPFGMPSAFSLFSYFLSASTHRAVLPDFLQRARFWLKISFFPLSSRDEKTIFFQYACVLIYRFSLSYCYLNKQLKTLYCNDALIHNVTEFLFSCYFFHIILLYMKFVITFSDT